MSNSKEYIYKDILHTWKHKMQQHFPNKYMFLPPPPEMIKKRKKNREINSEIW